MRRRFSFDDRQDGEKVKAHPQLGACNIVLTDVFTSVIVSHGFRVGRGKKPSESR